ncbi:MAG: amino acid adenylation domain-containing protein [Verrucomicrobiales bacterium]
MENVENIYPLSPAQEGMLFHTLAEPRSGVYVEQLSCQLNGSLDVAEFQKAWQATVDEHAVLRTAFLWEGLDEPLQVVHKEIDVNVRVVDKAIGTFLAEDRKQGFDLTAAPCLRLTLFRESATTHTFVWTFHHLLSDGWSTPRLLRDVFDRLGGKPTNVTKNRPYHEYIAWLQQQDGTKSESFWKGYLSGFDAPLELPIRRRSSGEAQYAQLEQRLPARESAALEERCRRLRITSNTLVLGAWALTLARYTQRQDVLFGMTVSGRPPSLPGVETMIGNFINSVPLRTKVDENTSLEKWLAKLQETQGQLREHEHASLAKVQGLSDIPPGDALFETLFVYENYPADAEALSAPGLTVSKFDYREQSNYPLAALAVPGQRLRLLFIYDTTQFDAVDAEALLGHWKQVVAQLCALPIDSTLSAINVHTKEEEDLLRVDWNATKMTIDGPDTVIESLARAAKKNPAVRALALNRDTMSYAELDQQSTQRASQLINAGLQQGEMAAIIAGRSFDTVVAILAVMKTGCGYIPIDPTYPEERIRYLVGDSKARLILSDRELESPHIRIDQPAPASNAKLPKVSPTDPAYMIYTSGSTGKPRGVLVRHSQLRASTFARHHYYKDPVNAFLMLSSFSFDSSVAGLFWTLTQGGCLCLLDDDARADPGAMVRAIHQHGITHLLGIPSLIDAFAADHARAELASLRTIILAGEDCPPHLPARLIQTLPETRVYNEYGPTEATVWSTVHECRSGPIRIGKPIANTQAYVLDPYRRLVPIGVPGELYLGGAGITEGYYERDDLTSERFLADPFRPANGNRLYRTGDRVRYHRDGTLEFLGRMDNQVKHRGHRIELGEIEHALLNQPGIREACVLLQDSHVVSSSAQDLAAALSELPPDKAAALLSEIKPERKLRRERFEITLEIDEDVVSPPRSEQRDWLINQAMNELADDLDHLDQVAKRFARGAGTNLTEYDIAHSELSDDQIMQDWQTPSMKAMARQIAGPANDILEIGFGRGISASFLQSLGVKSHTIVESNDFSVNNHFKPWRARHPSNDITLVHSRWQEAQDQLDRYDGIFFHAFPLNEQEFIDTVVNSITFAEHFFPVAAELLRPGGSFAYLTTEIDSLSRRHQRALLKFFSSLTVSVEKCSPPADTRDTWWADSMVILKAVK